MRVNIDRARRYQRRTLARPPETYIVTAREREALAEWEDAWMRDLDEPPTPPVVEWQRQVKAYCQAKSLHLHMTVQENPGDMSTTLGWSTEGER